MLATIAQTLLPAGVVLAQVAGIIFLLLLIFNREHALVSWVGVNAAWLATLFLLAAAAGSLFYSEVIGFEPCVLCWWQRLFMYPQLLLFLVALGHKARDVFTYSIHLSFFGALVALYQILLPYFEQVGLGCGSVGPSCTKLYVLAFGYVTIPMMSFTVFGMLILLALANMMVDGKIKR